MPHSLMTIYTETAKIHELYEFTPKESRKTQSLNVPLQ